MVERDADADAKNQADNEKATEQLLTGKSEQLCDKDVFTRFDEKYHQIFKYREPLGTLDPAFMPGLQEYGGIAVKAKEILGEKMQYDASVHAENARWTMNVMFELGQDAKFPNYAAQREQIEETIIPVHSAAGANHYCHIFKPKCLTGNDNMAIVQCHGGGGIYWDPIVLAPPMIDFALRMNVVLVCPNYRKAPEFPQPHGTIDCRESIKWIYNNAERFGVNKNRIGVTGSSGGAQVALGAARMMKDVQGEKDMIRALWLEVPAIYFAWYEISDEQCENNIIDKQTKKGTVDAMKLHCTDFEKQVAEWDLEVFPGRMSVEDASNLPPTYVMTSEKDFMRRDAYAFAQTLEKAGKLQGFQDWPGAMHGFRIDPRLKQVDEYLEEWRLSIVESLK